MPLSDERHWFSEKVILLELTYACEAKVGGACVSRIPLGYEMSFLI